MAGSPDIVVARDPEDLAHRAARWITDLAAARPGPVRRRALGRLDAAPALPIARRRALPQSPAVAARTLVLGRRAVCPVGPSRQQLRHGADGTFGACADPARERPRDRDQRHAGRGRPPLPGPPAGLLRRRCARSGAAALRRAASGSGPRRAYRLALSGNKRATRARALGRRGGRRQARSAHHPDLSCPRQQPTCGLSRGWTGQARNAGARARRRRGSAGGAGPAAGRSDLVRRRSRAPSR